VNILVTNDDGILAPGIRHLAMAASEFGEVKVIAPERERSACGHSMTMADPLRIHRHDWKEIEAISVSGVPVDCINVGLSIAFPDGCDLVLSGFNSGPNLGFDVTYSGTVAGAMEGTINGIRSVALSMACFDRSLPFHFESGSQWLKENWQFITEVPLPTGSFLNVNIPSLPFDRINGSQIARMGSRIYRDQVEMRKDPWDKPYFWQGGFAITEEVEPGTDLNAILDHFVSITPIKIDWTDEEAMESINNYFLGSLTGINPNR